jgi:hypothetical protein
MGALLPELFAMGSLKVDPATLLSKSQPESTINYLLEMPVPWLVLLPAGL